MMDQPADWTLGQEGIAYQRCTACGRVQYFDRAFCASCGTSEPERLQSSGHGTVYSVSLVHRAATPEARAHVPYMIVLVDMDEGFRMMAHGAADLVIGDRVTARFMPFTDHIVPYFAKHPG